MATGTTDFSQIPPSAQALCEMIQKSFPDMPWGYVANDPVPEEPDTLQLRNELATRTKTTEVKQYAKDMKAGDLFPPTIRTLDRKYLDGVHRLEALNELRMTDKRHAAKWATFHTIVIGWNYADAPTAIHDQFTMLIAKANHRHGYRYSKGEIEALISSLVGDNAPADIARTMGVSLATVKAVMSAKKARDRARDLNLDTSGIARTTMEEIARRPNLLTEEPFTKVIELVQKTPITRAEVAHLLDRMAEAPTEARKVELAEAERASRALQERAAENGSPKVGATLSQQSRMHWAFFLSHEDDPSLLVEKNELMAPEHYSQAARVIGVLRKTLTAQAQLEGDDSLVTE